MARAKRTKSINDIYRQSARIEKALAKRAGGSIKMGTVEGDRLVRVMDAVSRYTKNIQNTKSNKNNIEKSKNAFYKNAIRQADGTISYVNRDDIEASRKIRVKGDERKYSTRTYMGKTAG